MRLWLLDEDKGFSVKSFYTVLAHSGVIPFSAPVKVYLEQTDPP